MSTRLRDALRLHVPMVLGVTLCTVATWIELDRARHGHTLAWVYVVEWPLFGVAGLVMWFRLVTDQGAPRPPRASIPEDDPGLVAWRAYVQRMEEPRGPAGGR